VLILTGETEQKTITNKKVLPISVQLNAEKMLRNADSGRPYKLEDGQFEFELYKSEKDWKLQDAQLLETRKN
ncbi:hypothetical protein RF400_02235, partial [Acinetobacter baumannii]|nr:hypothetical protein [Acinetobacter baumannii]